MILEIQRTNNQFLVTNFPADFDHFFVTVNAENLSFTNKTTEFPSNDIIHKKAIVALQLALADNPALDYIKRKISSLQTNPSMTETMTDDEALYIALMEKYGK
jgi:hypothetical protein